MALYYPSVNALGVSTQGNTGGNTGTSNGTWVAVGSNNITISQSTGTNNLHSLFFFGPSPAGGAAFSGGASNIGNTSGNTGTVSNQLVLAGGNNITLSQSTNAGGATITVSAFNQSNQQLSLYAVSNTTQSTSGTMNASNISFHGAGIASVGVSNGSVVISVPAGGGGGDGVNILAAGTQTANTTGTVVFANSNRVTFGMSNSSVVTASVEPPIWSHWSPFQGSVVAQQLGLRTLGFAPMSCPQITIDRIQIYPIFTNATNSTGSVSATWSIGIYTQNASSLSLATSGSGSGVLTFSGTVRGSLNTGVRVFSIPVAASISEGQYWIGFVSSSATGGANASISHLCMSSLATVYQGSFGQASSATGTVNASLGFGNYSATTGALPSSVAFSHIQGQGGVIGRTIPYLVFASGSL